MSLLVTERAEACRYRLPPRWYALRVRSNRERSVQTALFSHSIEEYLPVTRAEVRWSDRTKTVERPLIPGYIFCRITPALWGFVLQISGVVQILGSPLPQAIEDEEIQTLRTFLAAAPQAQACAFAAGETVRINRGAFAGLEGVISRVKGELRLVIGISLLGRAASAEVDAADVEAV